MSREEMTKKRVETWRKMTREEKDQFYTIVQGRNWYGEQEVYRLVDLLLSRMKEA